VTVDTLRRMFAHGDVPLDQAFELADTRARRLQSRYQRVVQQAVWGGLGSLVCSFASIAFGSRPLLVYAELFFLIVMVLGVIEGLIARYHHHWILERHRAERLRLLRFSWLIDPAHWDLPDDALPELQDQLQQAVNRTRQISDAAMKQWCRETRWPDVTLPSATLDPAFVARLRRDYVDERLNTQLAYFIGMAERRERLDTITWFLPAAGFFIAIALSAFHLVAEVVGTGNHLAPASSAIVDATVLPPGGWLLFLILALPTAGAAARLLRTAFEFARNRQRFVLTALELERTRGQLEAATEPLVVARAMARAELALEQEHRAWLLLMTEAEWYG
jgi:hypothetical protein